MAIGKRRPFIKDLGIDLRKIMSNDERRQFIGWCKKLDNVLFVYNKTEKLLIFFVYNKGYSRMNIEKKTTITKYYYDTFFQSFRQTDEFDILKAQNEYWI